MKQKSASHFAAVKSSQQIQVDWNTISARVPKELKARLQSRINISKTVRDFLIQLDRELSEQHTAQ
jgi:hypothetical protein